MDFEPFDIILTRAGTPLSRLIRFFSGGWSHVAVFVSPMEAIHADEGFVQRVPIKKLLSGCSAFKILRIDDAGFDHEKAVEFLIKRIGVGYDYLGVFGRFVHKIFSMFKIPKNLIPKFESRGRYFCSELIGATLLEQGFKVMGKPPSQLDPADFEMSALFYCPGAG